MVRAASANLAGPGFDSWRLLWLCSYLAWSCNNITLFLLLQQGFLIVSPDRQHLHRLIILWNLVATTQEFLLLPTEVDVRRSTSVVMFSKEVCKFLLNARQCRMGPVLIQSIFLYSTCRIEQGGHPAGSICHLPFFVKPGQEAMFMVDLRSLVSIWFPEPSNKGHLRLWHAGGQGD